jgi:hypothetical protein
VAVGERQELVFVLAVSVVAVLAGAADYRQIADMPLEAHIGGVA